MARKIIPFLLLVLIFIFSKCTYDNNEDLYADQDSSSCDTLNVTYNVQIKPFFDGKCISCHYAGGDYPTLDNYTGAHDYATTTGNLLYEYVSTNHKSKNPTACEIAQIKKWIETGAN